jgi:transposase
MNAQPHLPEHHINILELYRQGWTQTHIAKALGYSRRTVYNHIHQRVFLPGKHRGRPKGSRKLLPFEAYVRICIERDPHISMSRLLGDLRSMGYSGGLSILRDFCRAEKGGRAERRAAVHSASPLPSHAPKEGVSPEFAHFAASELALSASLAVSA